MADVTGLTRQMLRESRSPDKFSDEYIRNLLECVFLTILRKCDGLPADRRSRGVKEALLYLHSHFQGNPSMAQVARSLVSTPIILAAVFAPLPARLLKAI